MLHAFTIEKKPEKRHFQSISGHFWTKNLKIRLFQKKLFLSVLRLCATVTFCQKSEKS